MRGRILPAQWPGARSCSGRCAIPGAARPLPPQRPRVAVCPGHSLRKAVWAADADDGRARAGAEARDAALVPPEAGVVGGQGHPADRRRVRARAGRPRTGDPPAHGRWVGLRELDGLRLRDEEQRELLTGVPRRARAGRGARGARRRGRGRLARATSAAWLEREWRGSAASLRGIEQVKHWSISSVLRIETDGPDLYFKVSARLPLFVEEASVTAMLAERFPGYVPAPLAVEPERGWFLLPEFDDLIGWQPPLESTRSCFAGTPGCSGARSDLTAELLADGCLDRRLDVLESAGRSAPRRPRRDRPPDAGRGRGAPATRADAEGSLSPPGRLRSPRHARPRRPPPRERRPDRRRARLFRLDGRVHRAIHSSTSTRCSGSRTRRPELRCSTRISARGRGSSHPSACARPPRWPRS